MSKNNQKHILSSNPTFNFNVKLQQLDKLRYCIDDLKDAFFVCRPPKSINNKSPYLCDICLTQDIEHDQCKKSTVCHCPQLDVNQTIVKDTKLLVQQKIQNPKSKNVLKSSFLVLFHYHNNTFICSAPQIAEQQFLFFFQDFIISKQTTLSFSDCLSHFTSIYSPSFLNKNAKLRFDFVLQQKLKDGVGEQTYTTGPKTFVEIKNVIIADGPTAKFPFNDKPKKFGDFKIISSRCIKQAFFIMKFLQLQKQIPSSSDHHFAFIFFVNRSDISQFLLSDPLFSDLLFNCLLLGCSIIAYRINWTFSNSNSRAISSINKTLPIQFFSNNLNFTYKPFSKINTSKMKFIPLDEHLILKHIFSSS